MRSLVALLAAITFPSFASALTASPGEEAPGQILWATSGIIAQGQVASHQVRFEDSTETVVTLMYASGTAHLALVSPAGDVIDSANVAALPGAQWAAAPSPFGGMMEFFAFPGAPAGLWTLRVTAPKVVEPSGVCGYLITVMIQSRLTVTADVRPEHPVLGDRLLVSGRLAGAPGSGLGTSMVATVLDPERDRQEFTLRDDGTGADSAAGDFVYTAETQALTLVGSYSVVVTAHGPGTGSDSGYTRIAYTGAFVTKSRSLDDIGAALAQRHPGPDEPPVEIRVEAVREKATGSPSYEYTVANGSPFPLTSFGIGTDPQSSRGGLGATPLGWADRGGIPEASRMSPPGWNVLYGIDIESRGTLTWVIRDTSAAIGPGETRSGYRITTSRPDSAYLRAQWSGIVQSPRGDFYRGVLVSGPSGPHKGDAMERLGRLTVSPRVMREKVVVRYKAPESARPEVSILDSTGHLVQVFPRDDSRGVEREFTWDGRNAAGQAVPDGEYFVEVAYGNTQRFGRVTVRR